MSNQFDIENYPSYSSDSFNLDPHFDHVQTQTAYTQFRNHNLSYSHHFYPSYKPAQHGFSYERSQLPPNNHDSFSHSDSIQWAGYERHIRYVSPTTSGVSLTGSESSSREHLYGDEQSSHHVILPTAAMSGPMSYMNPSSMPSPVHTTWQSQSSFTHTIPSTPAVPSQMDCATLRDMQLEPDTQIEDDIIMFDEAIEPRIQAPEEVCPSKLSRIDSGLGQSIPDSDSFEDDTEEDEITQERSDSDPDFVLHPTNSRKNGTRGSPRVTRRAIAVLDTASKVNKASNKHKAHIQPQGHGSASSRSSTRGSKDSKRMLPCTFHHFGCEKEFGNKNEWKRHINSQHVQLGYFRCDMGVCHPDNQIGQRSFNDFNRKDLFTQHCRRMHAPYATKEGEPSTKEKEDFEKEMDQIRDRCWQFKRLPPSRGVCGFCHQRFTKSEGKGPKEKSGAAWDDRLDHVVRHYERDRVDKKDEIVDEDLKAWALEEGVIRPGRNGQCWLIGHEPTNGGRRTTTTRRTRRGVATTETTRVVNREPELEVSSEEEDAEGEDE